MSFNIKNVSNSLIHSDIRGSISIINTSDLNSILDLARRAVVSEDALSNANKRISELDVELKSIRGSSSITNIDVDVSTSVNITNESNDLTDENIDNGFEDGKKRYREQGCINKVRIISLAVSRVKPNDIIDIVLKSEHPKRKYSKAYISSVYSPKTVKDLDDLVKLCSDYCEYLDGVSLDAVKAFLYSRYTRKVNRRAN